MRLFSNFIISNFSQVKPNLRSSNKFGETDESDDLILLEGCGQISQWQFPADLTKCPLDNCDIQFAVRSDAIIHYKNQHAKKSIYCSICDIPIYAEHVEDLKGHYEGKHIDVDVDLNFKELQAQVNEVRNRSIFSINYSTMHLILIPLML